MAKPNRYATSRRAAENRLQKATFVAAFVLSTRIDRTLLFAQPGEDADAELTRDRRRREVERSAGVRVCSEATWIVIGRLLDRDPEEWADRGER